MGRVDKRKNALRDIVTVKRFKAISFLSEYFKAALFVLSSLVGGISVVVGLTTGSPRVAFFFLLLFAVCFVLLATGASLLVVAVLLKAANKRTWILAAVGLIADIFLGKAVVLEAYGKGSVNTALLILLVTELLVAIWAAAANPIHEEQ
eukprot:m.253302 g.253302  ORF g.253302 m.253302 type:complete len:149 (+) comp40369_c1_seq3:339-785(+)